MHNRRLLPSTSRRRAGLERTHPGLIIEVYNWIRPRDISHYERFAHYHDTFYRHVEATSVTPFSERARDRALHGVLASFVRQSVPGMAMPEASAGSFDQSLNGVQEIVASLRNRSYRVTDNENVADETGLRIKSLTDDWSIRAHAEGGLVYSVRGVPSTGRGVKEGV